ncbi:hypothetical protein SKAU_G00021250 [Synaphobranchus kaupii]|uniref:Uncharacterized protein n=1 Tax=Synaphobranchus kaupii TaxID=118154 RepID=A0A9Q1GDP2_SYNKA|nr:hypothetical protein SKAU_G00021250 [Synaphobranchus kaupii]
MLRKENRLLRCSRDRLSSEVEGLRHDLKLTNEALQECSQRVNEITVQQTPLAWRVASFAPGHRSSSAQSLLVHATLPGTEGELGCFLPLDNLIENMRSALQPHRHLTGETVLPTDDGIVGITTPLLHLGETQRSLIMRLVGSTHHRPLGVGDMILALIPPLLSQRENPAVQTVTPFPLICPGGLLSVLKVHV